MKTPEWVNSLIGALGKIKVFNVQKLTPNQILLPVGEEAPLMFLGTCIESLAGVMLSWVTGGPTHCILIDPKDSTYVYHSIFIYGVVRERLEDVVCRYNKLELRRMTKPVLTSPETQLGRPYDSNLDYQDHDQQNCVEFLNVVFETDCLKPKDFRSYSEKVQVFGSNAVEVNMGDTGDKK